MAFEMYETLHYEAEELYTEINVFLEDVLSEMGLKKSVKNIDNTELLAKLSRLLDECQRHGIINDFEHKELFNFLISWYIRTKIEWLTDNFLNIETDFSPKSDFSPQYFKMNALNSKWM